MLRHPFRTTVVATVYLLLYVVCLKFPAAGNLASILFFFSPVVLLLLAYSILRYGTYKGKEFSNEEEWGYQDRSAEKLS